VSADEPISAGAGQANRRREIENAVEDLNALVRRIQALIPRVNEVIDRRTEATRRRRHARVVHGGGSSAFAGPSQSINSQPRRHATRALIVAVDLALAGYSREQIEVRLRERGGAAAAQGLEEVFE
jgi:hypothetical protein